ncbi:TPA: type II secretion system F family protein, partial [Pasteurella multocida]|nr:type II secretion system F family protein [Pasteurella multocida]HDR1086297.1 type II secretion system F family protein [Pasteurella multocida]HDR1315849.1 type II secretion system F family protein [Pasteurella multocida]
MTLKFLLFSILLTAFGLVVLFLAIAHKKKLERGREILAGEIPKDKSETEVQKGKSKQQIELELLLINNNSVLRFLGLVDKNIKVKLMTILV